MLNAVCDELDRRLALEAVRLDTGQRCRCGRLARFVSGHVIHIDGDRSHQCDPCEFCLSCPRCHRRLEDRGEFDGTEASTGVVGGHQGFGEVYQCEGGGHCNAIAAQASASASAAASPMSIRSLATPTRWRGTRTPLAATRRA